MFVIVIIFVLVGNLPIDCPRSYDIIKTCLVRMMGASAPRWSVVAEWLGCRTLNQRVVGLNPGVVSVSRIP
jgi:hypothetical protein